MDCHCSYPGWCCALLEVGADKSFSELDVNAWNFGSDHVGIPEYKKHNSYSSIQCDLGALDARDKLVHPAQSSFRLERSC
jgi:hypothetical protein